MNKFLNGIKYFFSTMWQESEEKFLTGYIVTSVGIVLTCMVYYFGIWVLLAILGLLVVPHLIGHIVWYVLYSKEKKEFAETLQRIQEIKIHDWESPVNENTPKTKQPDGYYF